MTQALNNDHTPQDAESGAFRTLQQIVRTRFENLRGLYGPQLFRTSAANFGGCAKTSLFQQHYIGSFPTAELRQHHRCTACEQFIHRFGDLVFIDKETGEHFSAFWGEAGGGLTIPEMYAAPVRALQKAVQAAKVVSPFYAAAGVWGVEENQDDNGRPWNHFCINYADEYDHALKSPEQGMAAKAQDFQAVQRAITEFKLTTIAQGVTFFQTSAEEGHKIIAPQLEWLHETATQYAAKRSPARDNVLWQRIAAAPDGFCHPRSGVVGNVLESLVKGYTFDQIKKSLKELLDPTKYQRAQVAPSAGNIKQAEEIIEKMGLATALQRRFATPADILPGAYVWQKPAAEAKPAGEGVFGHLKAKGDEEPQAQTPRAQTITWRKFKETILPNAKSIRVQAPVNGNYAAYVTAVHAEAAPILKWDDADQRNPVSWYLYTSGSAAFSWGLQGSRWYDVPSILLDSPSWTGKPNNVNDHNLIVIAEAADSRNDSLALYSQVLRSELHSIRSTIEAFSNAGKLAGNAQGSLSGLMVSASDCAARLRVDMGNGVTAEYLIDRWD